MGVCNWFCLSNGVDLLEDEANMEISHRLKTEQQKQDHDKTALLIGPPNAGKTTILKQFYFTQKSQGSNEIELEFLDLLGQHCLEEIRSNCLETINILGHYLRTNMATKKHRRCTMSDHFSVHFQRRPPLSELKSAWKAVRKLYTKKAIAPSTHRKRRSRWLRLKENMAYFLDRIEEIMDEHYQLTPRDLIMHKTESLAVSRHHGSVEGFNGLHLIDFGAVSPLRLSPHSSAKSLKLFENVDGILFVAALSDYCVFDPKLGANRLTYSLRMFEALTKLKWFGSTKIFLVLSKVDVLRQRLKSGISLTEYFGDAWDGSNDYKNRKMPLTVAQMTRALDLEVPVDIERVIVSFLVESDHDDCRLSRCTKTAASFIAQQFVAIYDRHRALHAHPLNVDWYFNVCTDEHVMRATLWGIRGSLYD